EVDAAAIAEDVGTIKVVNTIMIGKLAHIMGGDKKTWMEAVKACVPQKTVEINEQAFNRGYEV
ncbi:MAG: 2-oxoacid:acceptor oxidoreductase family protein, partial [Eubacteriales bacterium]